MSETFFLSFFLSCVSKTQPNHWTKRMGSRTCPGPGDRSVRNGIAKAYPQRVGKTVYNVFGLACTARSREDETRNGHQNIKGNPRWSSQV